MLVLSRKQKDTIVIDGQIRIEVLKVKGNSVKLGIVAPNNVKILRGELAPYGKEPAHFPISETTLNVTPRVAQAS